MINNEQVRIYIDSSKPYYYPGEEFLASILLDVLENVKCNKMIIIAKGKQIVKATQRKLTTETEENMEEDSEDEEDIKNKEEVTEINESKNIFKYKKVIKISKNDYLKKGKYTFPFEVQIPEDIPGSFLFLESKAYAEIIYSIQVKLNNINLKERIPIVIRQKVDIFNYPNESEYTKNLAGCCCKTGETKIKLNNLDKFTINGNDIKLNVNINNQKSGASGSPINIEIYQKLVLKNKNKKIKITKIAGKYKGKKIINPRENYDKNISISLDSSNYAPDHLSETKSIKYFRHQNVLPLLNQSVKSNFINNEYEIYAETQFSNISADELGVFLMTLIYPPEKGILSKTISKIAKEFSDSIINNKKIFLNNESNDYDPDFENENLKYTKSERYKETESDQESKYSENFEKKIKKNGKQNKNKDKDNDNDNANQNDENNINNINNVDKKINNSQSNDNNINENLNILESQRNNPGINDKNNKKSYINTDEISFGTSTKDRANLFVTDTTSNNIKKNFNQTFLNDALDDDFLDIDSMK